MMYIDGKLLKGQAIWCFEIGGEIWKLLSFFVNTPNNTQHTKNTTITVKRYVKELVSPRTMGHLIEKNTKWLVNICSRNIFRGVHKCISDEWWNKKLQPVMEIHLDSTAIMLLG